MYSFHKLSYVVRYIQLHLDLCRLNVLETSSESFIHVRERVCGQIISLTTNRHSDKLNISTQMQVRVSRFDFVGLWAERIVDEF